MNKRKWDCSRRLQPKGVWGGGICRAKGRDPDHRTAFHWDAICFWVACSFFVLLGKLMMSETMAVVADISLSTKRDGHDRQHPS